MPTIFGKVRDALGAVIFGQDEVIEETLITLLAGGHGLLIGVPGLAKTKLVESLGIVMGLDTSRVQFTPDLMPADITGSEVMEESASGSRAFRFIRGPVFTELLMADEINRASPRTQSALLQAMQEKHVTVAGVRHDLPKPFHVLATQNPLEQEGTYPLPEAQLDRFLLQIDVGYPDLEAERRMLLATTMGEEKAAERIWRPEDLIEAQGPWCAAFRWERKSSPSILQAGTRGTPRRRGRRYRGRRRRVGSRPSCQPSADVSCTGTGPAGWKVCSVYRRCRGTRSASPAPPHGIELHRPGRRSDHGRRD